MNLKERWNDVTGLLTGPNKSLMRGTTVETEDGSVMFIVFDRSDVYHLPHRDRAIAELAQIVTEKFGKEFAFRAKLKSGSDIDTRYVTEDELSRIINMDIEIEG